ncbi:carbon-nitrogen hydrolase family protein [Emcibacter sp.]|uniref:carbon-nitrogen hydrolase family protein n=1 Tax=Emcibacter sp. TaxID=1979954 RepID=UPI002AA66303|nr:carbon-nitrogen hydrolase family protein [Emcibacter sp.]
MSQTYKVAVVQAAPVFMDLKGTVEKTKELIREAAGAGASIVAFPETWIPGYPWWIWMDAPAWWLQFVPQYHENSLALDSEEFESLKQEAKSNNIHVMLGYSERATGSLYMGQCLIGSDGELVYSRRKLKPTHVERTVFGEGDGSDFKVADTPLGRIGALCCWEHLQPLNRYAMFGMHEQVHVAAWPSFSMYEGLANALGPEVNTSASRMYAVEGQCFVLAPCMTITQEMIDLVATSDFKKGLIAKGGGHARIFGPDGQELCDHLAPDEEGILYADIDLGMIVMAKSAADPVGHYSRPDVTRLLLDARPKSPVEYVRDSGAENVREEEDLRNKPYLENTREQDA